MIGDYSQLIMQGQALNRQNLGDFAKGIKGIHGTYQRNKLNSEMQAELDKARPGYAEVTDYSEPMTSQDFTERSQKTQAQAAGEAKPAGPHSKYGDGEYPDAAQVLMGAMPAAEAKPEGEQESGSHEADVIFPPPKQVRREAPPVGVDWDKVESIARLMESKGLKPMYSSAELENRRIAEKKMEFERAIREADYRQLDLDSARSHFDRAEQQAKSLHGNITAAERQAFAEYGSNVPDIVKGRIEQMKAEQRYWQQSANKFRSYIEANGGGRKPSNALFADEMANAGGQGTDSGGGGNAGDRDLIGEYIDAFEGFEMPRNIRGLMNQLGIDKNLEKEFESRMKKAIESNNQAYQNKLSAEDTARKRKWEDEQRQQSRDSHKEDLKAKKNANVSGEIAADVAEGSKKSIIKFLNENNPYNKTNAIRLDELVKDYKRENPKNAFEFIKDWYEGADETRYNEQIKMLKEAFAKNSNSLTPEQEKRMKELEAKFKNQFPAQGGEQ